MNKNEKTEKFLNKTKKNNKSNGPNSPNSPKEFYFFIGNFPRAMNELIGLSFL